MAKKKKDPLAAAAQQVVKDTVKKTAKQAAPAKAKVQNAAKKVAGNVVKNTAPGATKKTQTQAKPFKASNVSGTTGRSVAKQDRQNTAKQYANRIQSKRTAKSNVTATQKGEKVMGGNAVQRNVLQKNKPTRLSRADDFMLTDRGKNEVNNAKALYEAARRNNDEAGMKLAHGMAELARLNNQTRRRNDSGEIVGPYSGGTWGDRYIEANMGNFNSGQTGLREPEKNFLRSEAYQVRSALNEAGAGYLNTLREFPLRLPEGQGSSQLVVKGSERDKYSSDIVDRRGQSRYTEEDMANKALEFQAASDAQRELGYQTTPIDGVVGRFIGDATRVGTGIGLDALANTVVPGAGLVNMGARTWGSQVKQAKDEQKLRGTDKEPFADLKAYMYGTAMTGVEVATEKMFDGVKLFGKSVYGAGGATTKLDKMMDDVFNVGINRAVARLAKTPGGEAAISALMNIGKSGLEEGLEELVADFVQWQMPKIYGGDVEGAKEMLTGALYDFALGAAMGGFGGVTSTGSSMREAYLDRANRNAETISDRMSALGADKEQAKTALSRMTIGELENLTEASDEVLTNVGREMGLISSQNENQSLTGASEEQRSEQTVEGEQPTVSRSKAKDALRKRLRGMEIRDAERLRGIMDGLSAQEMDSASRLSPEELSAWVERRESGEIVPEAPARVVDEEGEVISETTEEDLHGISSAQAGPIAQRLSSLGVDGPTVGRALTPLLREGTTEDLERINNMTDEEIVAWARGEEPVQPATLEQQEALRAQGEALKAQAQEGPAVQTPKGQMSPVEIMGSTLGKNGRDALVKNYSQKDHPVGEYVLEMFHAYNAGFAGTRLETLTNRTITRPLAELMYRAGQADSTLSFRAQKDDVRNKVAFKRKDAGLHVDEYVQKKLDGPTMNQLDRLGKALGVQIYYADSVGGMDADTKESIANGSYSKGVVLIAKDSIMPVDFVIGHELTHRMKDVSPEAYQGLLKYFMSLQRANQDIESIISAYAEEGMTISHETAIEEAVADFVGKMINDQQLLERFAEKADRNVVQRFLDALKALARKLTGKQKEGLDEAIDIIENALKMSVKANKRLTARKASVTEALEGRALVDSETGEKFSLRSIAHDMNEGVMFEDLVNAGVMSQKDVDELRKNMTDLVHEMVPFAHILDQNEAWSKEERPYAPLKPNSDPLYKISLDFTTLCRKRLLTQAVIERIQTEEKKATTSDRQLKIRALLKDYREIDNAVQVACGMCYVEAARLKSPKVVNEFLNKPEPIVRNYFAKKDSGFEAYVKEEGAKLKVRLGYDRNATKSEMSNADRNKLNDQNAKLRREYKLSTAQQAIMDKIKAMPPETFLSEANLTKLLVEEPVIYDIFISKVRAATRSKALQGPVPYYYGDSKGALSDRAVERMNAENGLRFQSWSDWQVQHLLDMMTAVIDLSVRGVKMHGYTKFPEEVRIFGNTGMQFNLSGVLGTVEPILNEDGTYSERNFDTVEGVDIAEAKKVRDEFPDTAGIQCIGVSDAQILSLLNTDWIDYVIPYHSSGLNKSLRKIAGIEKWEDYTKVQEAHPIDKKAEPGPGQDAENWHKEPAFSEFMIWDGENGLDCMRKSADRYVQLCEERGMVPKFNALRTSGKPGAENYWKLLIDRKMINQKTGKLIIQQEVTPNFNFKAMRDAIRREVDGYDPTREDRVFKYVVENGSKRGIRFSKEMKEKAASIGNTLVENVAEERLSLKNVKVPSYDELISKGPVQVVNLMDVEPAGLHWRDFVESKQAEQIIRTPVKNKDTGENIFIVPKTFNHSFSGKSSDKVRGLMKIREIVENSVLTHAEQSKKADDRTTGVYTFLGFVNGSSGLAVSKVTVKEFTNRGQDIPKNVREYLGKDYKTYSSVYDSRIFVVDEIEKRSVASDALPAGLTANTDITPDLTLNVSEFYNLVKESDRRFLPQAGTRLSLKKTKRQEKRDNGEKLTEKQFYGLYSAHIIAGGRQADDPITQRAVESIKADGFQGDGGQFGANVLPTSSSSTVKGYTVEELRAQGRSESTIKDLQENPRAYGATWVGDRLYYNLNTTMMKYGARKGQAVLLVPESDVDANDKIRQGFKPFDYEIVTVGRDFQPYYELYSKAYDESKERPKYSLKSRAQFNDTVVLEESTVDTYLRDYAAPSSPNYAQAYIVHMSPRQFLDLTTSRTGRVSIERDATDLDLEQLADATRFQPFQLRIDHETGEVTGHEGRHRMEALRRSNVYNVPVLLFDSSNKNSKEAMDSLTLTGQDFGSTRSLARTTVHDVLPLNYANRDEIIRRFATQPADERIAENYGSETVRYSFKGGRAYEELLERYGSIAPGERRARNVAVPRQTNDYDRVSQTVRTIMEAARTPEELIPTIEEMIESGEFSYSVFGDKPAIEQAQQELSENGWDPTYAKWSSEIERNVTTKANVAMGWVLFDTAVKEKNWESAARITFLMTKLGRNAGQALQAIRILKLFPPEMQLAVMGGKKPKHVQDKLDRRKAAQKQEEEDDFDDFDLPDSFFGEEEEEGEEAPKKPKPKQKPKKKREPKRDQDDTEYDPDEDRITEKDVEDTAEYQAKHSKSTLVDMWNSWRYLAMLFNARTHIRNIVGNLGFAPIVMSKNMTATAAEIAIYHTVGKHFGMKRTKGVYNPRAFSYAWKDYELMRPVIMGEAKYEGQDAAPDEVVFRGILAPLEKPRKFNSKMLDLEDSWFSRPQYANALAQYMAANGITVEMMETGAGEITRGPHKGEHISAEIMDEARAYAVLEAQKATYRDLNDLSSFFMRVGKPKNSDPSKVEKVVHVLIEGVIPFRKTPANILVRAMEYSPVGLAHGFKKLLIDVPRTARIQQKIAQGKELSERELKFEPVTVAEALDRLCSGMSGTAIFALGMTLAKLGILVAKTDNGDDDQKYFLQLLGHQQWAIEAGGYSFTIDWLAPEVVPLFMGAQYFTGFQEGDPIRNFTNLADSLSMVIDPVMELSCMSGIQESLNNFAKFSEGDVNSMVAVGSNLALSYFSQGIPTLFGQLERASQEQRMTTFTQDGQLLPSDWQYQIGKLSAKIPGWDYHQIPYVDSWGNTETETVLWKRIVANMFNPAYVKKIDTRDVNKELQRLYDATGDGDVLPKPGWKTYRYTDENGKNQTVYLTEEEYLAYGRAKGRNQFDLVSKFLKSNAYKNMTDPDRANVLDDIYYYSEYKAQKEYINNYKGEPYDWVKKYEEFSNAYGGYDVSDYIIVRSSTSDVKGLYDPNKPGSNAISNTSSAAKALAIYKTGVKIPSDPEMRNQFLDALGVSSKEVKTWNPAQTEEFLEKIKKKYGITE